MRLVAVNGSPRKAGNTARLLKEITQMAESRGAEVSYYDLIDVEFEDCHACRRCQKDGVCALDDGMMGIKEDIQKADALVFASPIYMGAETGIMKCFVDRLYAFMEPVGPGKFRSRLKPGKKAFVFFTCGQADGDKVYNHIGTRYVSVLARNLELLDVRVYIVPGADPAVDIRTSPRAKEMLTEAKRFLNA